LTAAQVSVPVAENAQRPPSEQSGFTGGEPRRFAFIDALRGLAALAVCGVHFFSDESYHGVLLQTFPRWISKPLELGTIGVQVFFVLSGFVIAYSIRKTRVTGRFLGNFALRRSLRLDPPYWTTLFMVLAINVIGRRLWHDVGFQQPSAWDVVINMLYLPQLLGRPQFIVSVAWTLAIEIQFYLVLVTAVGISQRIGNRRSMGYPTFGYAIFFTTLAAAALASRLELVHISPAVFLVYWLPFFLGALACWSLEGTVWSGWFWIFATLTSASYFGDFDGRIFGGVFTALAIYAGGRLGKLYDWGNVAPLQFLGKISYSLYLGHAIVGQKTIKLAHRFLGPSPLAGTLAFLAAFVVSILAAYLMYRFLERPSVRLARRFKLRPEPKPQHLPTAPLLETTSAIAGPAA